ncbi:MAG: hypothetical protein VW397_04240 [Candidatus Margulisiibacteriota bacterium]
MALLKNKFFYFIKCKKGNALLLMITSTIVATFGIFFFTSLTTLDRESQERVAHLYNAYQMGIATNEMIQNRLFTKGKLEIDFVDNHGNYNYTEDEFEIFIEIQDGTILTLREMIKDDMITDADDPTATRLQYEPTSYDRTNSTLKIVFDMVIDSYDSNGNVVKKVAGINYLVNLAGYEVPSYSDYTNSPYNPGEPFYYLVSYADSDANLGENDITLKLNDVKFKGVLDTNTHGSGPQPDKVIILPIKSGE